MSHMKEYRSREARTHTAYRDQQGRRQPSCLVQGRERTATKKNLSPFQALSIVVASAAIGFGIKDGGIDFGNKESAARQNCKTATVTPNAPFNTLDGIKKALFPDQFAAAPESIDVSTRAVDNDQRVQNANDGILQLEEEVEACIEVSSNTIAK